MGTIMSTSKPEDSTAPEITVVPADLLVPPSQPPFRPRARRPQSQSQGVVIAQPEVEYADPIPLTLRYQNDTADVSVNPNALVSTLFSTINTIFNVREGMSSTVNLARGDEVLYPWSSFTDNNVSAGDTIEITTITTEVSRKPVIYLFSPNEIDASVTLRLNPEWKFSVIYPVVPQKVLPGRMGEEIQWDVRTCADGTLVEKSTGLEVSYLFWEAHANLSARNLVSPPPSPQLGQAPTEVFSPFSSDVCDSNSVLLHTSQITPYLDKSLKALGLHTEARTSFITFWLPYLNQHNFIALRFLPQAVYERAAPLNVTPKPDITTRVYMLFKGVSQLHVSEWTNAAAKAYEPVEIWREVVGVDIVRAVDSELFRVLEWGGMEIGAC